VAAWKATPHTVYMEANKDQPAYEFLKGCQDMILQTWQEGRTIDLPEIQQAFPSPPPSRRP